MSKILIVYSQTIINNDTKNLICFYDSINKELTDRGNDILWLNAIQELFVTKEEKFRLKKWILSWIDKIKNFKPDIIFTFNNRIFEEIIKVTDCPIVLFEADLVDFFVKTDLIKKYKERYYIVTFFPKYISIYKNLGFDEDKIILLHPATSVKKENIEKINNISFIGTLFPQIDYALKTKISSYEKNNFYNMMCEYWNKHNFDYRNLCDKYLPNNNFNKFDYFKIFDDRVYVLQSILDLGLKLYGVNWNTLHAQLINLASSFDSTPIYSLKDNQNVYNSSIINLSISHPQCEGYSFPWRIYDIMASSGVLVSSYSSALEDFTKGVVDVPMYKSPYDARNLCVKMLKEPNLRNDIIEASNNFIEKNGRWFDNLIKIQQCTNVKLDNNSTKQKGDESYIEYKLKKSYYFYFKMFVRIVRNRFIDVKKFIKYLKDF